MRSRHGHPIWKTRDGLPIPLAPLRPGEGDDATSREAFIQNLVHAMPDVLPMMDIEPAMAPLIPVCRELPMSGLAADNFWITSWGGLILGECKLVRNPQARREVIAQILEYARLMCAWSYEDLEQACRKARGEPLFKLWSLLGDEPELDEATFVDAVTRRLRSGRIMLLLIGDGIQEGVEGLAAHLQLHAGMHCGLALVELSLWTGPDGGTLVLPRVPMKTTLIERGIVTFDGQGTIRVAPPPRTSSPASGLPRASTQSEAEFFDRFGTKFPDLLGPLKAFLSSLGSAGISVEFRRSAVLRFFPNPDLAASAGFIDAAGQVWFNDAWNAACKCDRASAAQRYLEAVAASTGGKVLAATETKSSNVVDGNGNVTSVASLLPISQRWKEAMATFVAELSAPEDDTSGR